MIRKKRIWISIKYFLYILCLQIRLRLKMQTMLLDEPCDWVVEKLLTNSHPSLPRRLSSSWKRAASTLPPPNPVVS